MNKEASIDSLISQMGKSPELPTSNVSEDEILRSENIDNLVRRRVTVLMRRKSLTSVDIELLATLLKHVNK